MGELYGSAGLACDLDHQLLGLVALRRGRDERHPQLGAGDHQRGADVGAVTEVGHAHALEPAEPLANRHHVGQRLARVRAVRETVDHWDRRVAGELLDVFLRERADHQPVEVARQHGGGVLQGLATPELKVGGCQVQAHSAELEDADLERDACAGGRLLKDHHQRAAGEEVVLLAPGLPFLEVVGQVERLQQLVAAPVGDAGEMAPLSVTAAMPVLMLTE